jgi:hypothetical protein
MSSRYLLRPIIICIKIKLVKNDDSENNIIKNLIITLEVKNNKNKAMFRGPV